MSPHHLRAAAAAALLAGISLGAPALAQTQPAPAPPAPNASSPNAPTSKTPEDPKVTAKAKDLLHEVQTGTMDRAQLADDYNTRLSDDTLKSARTELAAFGEPKRFDYFGKIDQGPVTAYVYRVTMDKGVLDEMIALDVNAKVVRMLFRLLPPDETTTSPDTAPTGT